MQPKQPSPVNVPDPDQRIMLSRCTDVWATRRLGDRRLGDNFFRWPFGQGWTFERRRSGDKNEALRLEQPQRRGSCKRSSVISCFETHLSKVHRRSNTDWQRLKRLWSRLARRKPVSPKWSSKNVAQMSVAQTSCRPNVCRPLSRVLTYTEYLSWQQHAVLPSQEHSFSALLLLLKQQ